MEKGAQATVQLMQHNLILLEDQAIAELLLGNNIPQHVAPWPSGGSISYPSQAVGYLSIEQNGNREPPHERVGTRVVNMLLDGQD